MTSSKYTKSFLGDLYRMMWLIRAAEEALVEPVITGEVRCPVHLYIGEEAIATGLCATLREPDYIFGNHRSHGHYLAKGGDLKAMMAEILGKETGCARGRGGSMHLIAPEKGIMGIVPIVAGTISLATGASLAASIRQDGRVTVSFFGDGATGEGVLYESMNFASLHHLPIIFACENNLYSTHLPILEVRKKKDIFTIAEPFGIKTWQVDGNDVLQVHEHAVKATELCRNGEGPVFIEFLTYRMKGHVGPDDNIQGTHTDIRPATEIEEWKQKDPIQRFHNYLLEHQVFSKDELDQVVQDVNRRVDEAMQYARESQFPAQEEVMNYVTK
ncbi:MAG: thiamine pyrophosphate-dependent dehydrogenase E1 component subunit alpha [Bacteroidetes bacterium]|nr:thiamine pyrophosphate-dependent dehydrogenase E1 component subunit alpha [Bacteroidota bacterium]